MKIENLKVFDLAESIVVSGYPLRADLSDKDDKVKYLEYMLANENLTEYLMELVNNKASVLLEEKDFNANNLLTKIDEVLNNKKMLQEMHKNALKLGKPNSSDLIYKSIKELVGNYDGKSN